MALVFERPSTYQRPGKLLQDEDVQASLLLCLHMKPRYAPQQCCRIFGHAATDVVLRTDKCRAISLAEHNSQHNRERCIEIESEN